MEQRFSTDQVVELTGMTPRQLQWWDERGIVRPAREGRRRLYSLDDLAEVAVIGELRVRGFSLQRVRKLMRSLQREFGKRLVETVSAASDYHLLTDGSRIYLRTSPEQVVEVLKASRQPIFAICLSDTVRQIRAELKTYSPATSMVATASEKVTPLPRDATRAVALAGRTRRIAKQAELRRSARPQRRAVG